MKTGLLSGLPDLPSGLPDKEYGLVSPLYKAINHLARQVSGATGNIELSQEEMSQLSQIGRLTAEKNNVVYAKATVALTYGQLVNLHVVAGKIEARPADAPTLLPAHGIVMNTAGILISEYGEIALMQGHCAGVAGTVFGTVYYLGTAGAMQTPAPGGGALVQKVALGLNTLGVYLNIDML